MKELETLLNSYERELGKKPKLLGVALSSRKNLCVHPRVSAGELNNFHYYHSIGLFLKVAVKQEGKLVDGECFKLTASFVRERHKKDSTVPVCQFYEVN